MSQFVTKSPKVWIAPVLLFVVILLLSPWSAAQEQVTPPPGLTDRKARALSWLMVGFGAGDVSLALVRKAMERMEGRVWAESEPGQGATFYLEIPQTP